MAFADLTREEYLAQELQSAHDMAAAARKAENFNGAVAFAKLSNRLRQQLDKERERMTAEQRARAAAERELELTPDELLEAMREMLPHWPDQLLELAIDTYADRHKLDVDYRRRE